MAKVIELRTTVASCGPAVPAHLDRMSGDACDRPKSRAAVRVIADPHDAVPQCQPASHSGIHRHPPRLIPDVASNRRREWIDGWRAWERHGLFRCGAYAAARTRRPSIFQRKGWCIPPTTPGRVTATWLFGSGKADRLRHEAAKRHATDADQLRRDRLSSHPHAKQGAATPPPPEPGSHARRSGDPPPPARRPSYAGYRRAPAPSR
jgi:hypothetical protein